MVDECGDDSIHRRAGGLEERTQDQRVERRIHRRAGGLEAMRRHPRSPHVFVRAQMQLLAELSGRFRCQRLHHCDVLQQLLRYAMPLLQICRAVVGNPDFPMGIFPDQNLEREINCYAGSG